MYSVSPTFKTESKAQVRDIQAKIDIVGVDGNGSSSATLTGSDIIDFSIEQPFSVNGLPVLGMTFSAVARVHIKNPNMAQYFNAGTVKLTPYIGMPLTRDADGNVLTVEYMPCGTFTSVSCSSTDNWQTITIEAYDALAFLTNGFTPTLSFYTPIEDIVTEICTTYNLTLDPNIVFPNIALGVPVLYKLLTSGYEPTVRDWLDWIAGLMGKNCIMNRDGQLSFKGFDRCVYHVNPNFWTGEIIPRSMIYMDGTHAEADPSAISSRKVYCGVSLTFDDETSWGTSPSLQNQFSVYMSAPAVIWDGKSSEFANVESDVLAAIGTLPYYYLPCTIKYRCLPYLEVGDIVNASLDYEPCVFISDLTINVSGGLVSTIKCECMTPSQINLYTTSTAAFSGEVNNVVEPFPVGSVVITSTNEAPKFGGTWTLIDKEFTPTTATAISVGTGASNDFVLNSTNTTSMSAWVSRHGHSITLSVNAITFKVSVTGTNLTLGTFNLANLGASEATVSPIIMGWSDGAHAIVGMTINRTSGVMQSQDVVVRGTGTSIAAGSSAVFTVELPCDYQYMTDSLCNKFYWKRTA